MLRKTGRWSVQYRKHGDEVWRSLEEERNFWYADPMLFTYNATKLLFLEAFDEKKQIGRIAVSKMESGIFTKPEVIISKPYHMSYPCVFEFDKHIYMIPETSQNKTIELYRMESDYKKWRKVKNLLEGAKFVDSTVIIQDSKIYLYSYSDFNNKFVSYIFELEMKEASLKLLSKNEHDKNLYRSAGNVFCHDGKLFIPFQNNIKMYGEGINIVSFSNVHDLFKNDFCRKIDVSELKRQKGMNPSINRVHTLSYDDEIEIVDTLVDYDDKWAQIKSYRRRLRNLFFNVTRKNCREYTSR